ncbi:transposase [Mesorhizobium waimense]|uniref:Transposase n=1 Tax=Mesorhizobium waimense TaxID=1300307 RepID=A0A3A5KGE5_9HYPH|nr:transposase [Mesorhizobium waimense]
MGWTETTRRQYCRAGHRDANAMTDREWALIEPFLPGAKATGRPRTTELRAVVDALLYIAWTGCQWRALPDRFPPVSTVQRYFYAWRDNGLWRTINFHWWLRHAWPSVARRARAPASSTANRQRPRTLPVCVATTPARRSKAASAISSPTPRAPGRADGAYGRHPGQGWGSRHHLIDERGSHARQP